MNTGKMIMILTAAALFALIPGCKEQASKNVETRAAPARAEPAAKGPASVAPAAPVAAAAEQDDTLTPGQISAKREKRIKLLKSLKVEGYIPLDRAITVAKEKYPGGRAIGINFELDRIGGKLVPLFAVEMFNQEAGELMEVVINAVTGVVKEVGPAIVSDETLGE